MRKRDAFLKNKPLPIEVRELLMRNKPDEALKMLIEVGDVTEDYANTWIEAYKKDLREQSIAMQFEAEREKQEMENRRNNSKGTYIKAGIIAFLVLILLAVIQYFLL